MGTWKDFQCYGKKSLKEYLSLLKQEFLLLLLVVVVERICTVIGRGDTSIIRITTKTFFDIVSQRKFCVAVKNL